MALYMVGSRVSLHIFPCAKFIRFSAVRPFILCGGLLELQWVLGLVALVSFLDTEPLPCSHSLLSPSCLTKNLPLNVKSFQFSWGALGKFGLSGPTSELLIENPQRSSIWAFSTSVCLSAFQPEAVHSPSARALPKGSECHPAVFGD